MAVNLYLSDSGIIKVLKAFVDCSSFEINFFIELVTHRSIEFLMNSFAVLHFSTSFYYNLDSHFHCQSPLTVFSVMPFSLLNLDFYGSENFLSLHTL